VQRAAFERQEAATVAAVTVAAAGMWLSVAAEDAD